MTKFTRTLIILASAAVGAVSLPAVAQVTVVMPGNGNPVVAVSRAEPTTRGSRVAPARQIMMPGMGWGGNSFGVQRIVADLNMKPDFELTKDQKKAIQEILEVAKKENDAFQEKMKTEMAAFQPKAGGPPDMAGFREAMQRLQKDAPKPEVTDQKILALLTPEQKTAVEAEQKKQQEEMQKMWRNFQPPKLDKPVAPPDPV